MPPAPALIMLAGIYYGAQYGGSTTAILLNLPGEISLGRHHARRLQDGPQRPRRRGAGDLGARLVLRRLRSPPSSSLASGPPLTAVALSFGPAEYFSLMLLGLVIVGGAGAGLGGEGDRHGGARRCARPGRHRRADRRSSASPSASPNCPTASASSRSPWACSASPRSSATSSARGRAQRSLSRGRAPLPTSEEWKRAIAAPVLRGTALGSVLGILPGGGAVLASFALLYDGAEGLEGRATFGTGRDRGRGGAGSAPTTPRRRPASSRC